MKRVLTVVICAVTLLGSAPSTNAFEDDTFEAAAADIIVVRPVSFVATILGTALFVVSLPFTALSDSVPNAAEALVAVPARNTFTRPVGELSTLGD
ncbi:MAG TPA: hypothetical protein VF773_23300 [Verrucomicrobiae bacterium]